MKHVAPLHFTDFSNPALTTRNVLGLPLVSATRTQAARCLLAQTRSTVFFFNAHCANERARNRAYGSALRRADFVMPDGIGIELGARMDGKTLASNLNGTDFVPYLLGEGAKLGKSVYLLGGRPGTARAAAQRLIMMIPGLRIAGLRDGYDGLRHNREAVDDINESGADIVLVALGVPMQELWIDAHRPALDAQLVLGVGALFDFLAGNVRRAPAMVRRARLEWVWRLAMEPRRMARRYLVGNLSFLARSARFALAERRRARVMRGIKPAQRALDVALSLGALTLLAAPMLALALAIRLDSKGPALFSQERIGLQGKAFKVLKFRSMHLDAEARRAALLSTSDRDGICFKSRSDPRITRLGRILRRLSLDELPQLINVLKGEMSMVGPRPALPEEVAQYPSHALGRLQVKPGITGLWQVAGRANIGFDKMIDLDLAYVRARSVWLDLLIIALTFRAVVSGRGAC